MLWTLIWTAGIFVGYAIFMSQTPLRGYFSDALGLVTEKGSAHLWLAAGLISLAGAGVDLLRYFEDGGVFAWGASWLGVDLSVVAPGIPVQAGAMVGDLFSTLAAGGSREIGGGVRGVMVGLLGSLLMVCAALLLQYYILLFLYVRISSPAKRIRWTKLVELALRRFGRAWPLLPACWLVWAMPLVGWLPSDLVPWWRIGMALVFVAFAFLQVGLLSGERDFKAAVAFNFQCWRAGAPAAGWFVVIALVNFGVFALAEVCVSRSFDPGSLVAIVFEIAFVFVRCFVLVWLAGAWLLLFCDRLIGPKYPRPK